MLFKCRKLFTLKGSPIWRHAGKVGKFIGGRIYVHRLYARDVIDPVVLAAAHEHLPKDFKWNAVVYAWESETIWFDEAPDFDTAREPRVGKFVRVQYNDVAYGETNAIWHHKWLWVKDGYKGFDVKRSWAWSKKWLGELEEPASGSARVWKQQLAAVGLK